MLEKRDSLKKWQMPFLAISFFCAGFILRGAPTHPDVEFTKIQELGLFLIFLWFFICVLEWGKIVLYFLELSEFGLFGSMAAGTAWVSALGLLLGHMGFIGYDWYPLVCSLLLAGPVGSAWYKKKYSKSKKPWALRPKDLFEGLLLGFTLWTFVSLLANASLAHGTSDPFLYHLLGPRLWVDFGQIYLPTQIPITLQASTWEMLYLISQNFLGAPDGYGLIEGHLFSQYIHLIFGLGGCLCALYYLLRDIQMPRYWVWVALLAALWSPELLVQSWLGKNDWGILFWVLSATIILLQPHKRKKQELLFVSSLMGLAVAGKPNSIFFVIPVFCSYFLRKLNKETLKKRLLEISFVIGIILCTAAPILFRNWSYTGAPFFPFINFGLHHDILSRLATQSALQHPVVWHFSFAYIQRQLHWILQNHLIHGFIFLSPILALFFRHPVLRKLCWVLPISVIWILSAEISHPFVRWIGAPLVLSGFLFVLWGAEIINRIPLLARSPKIQGMLCLGLSALIYFNSQVPNPWTTLGKISPTFVIRSQVHWGGDSKAWLRFNGTFETPIFSTGDNQLYYISFLPVASIMDDPNVSRLTESFGTSDLLARRLYDLGFRYALDVIHWNQRYWTYEAFILDQNVDKHPEAIVYSGPNSQVIDLKIMNEETEQSCVQPHSASMLFPFAGSPLAT